MGLFKKDAFGHYHFIKRILISVIGTITFARYNWINKTKIEGTEHLEKLPSRNVLFVSNHQTYFAEVIAMIHVFSSLKWGFHNSIRNPLYLLNPEIKTSFIAAEETMKAGWLPKIFAYVGSVSIKRTWREAGKDINRQVDMSDISKIMLALGEGWVITFPQGTTRPYVEGRRGIVHIIRECKPIIVPVVIDGFRRSFDKKGLKLKKRGSNLSIKFKPPLIIDNTESSDEILEKVMFEIEQSGEFV
jgi:1-acyl-sn-glycerol-3-phosphate acyltransferase